MALIKIKQINNSTASSGDVITYNGTNNVWAALPGGGGLTTVTSFAGLPGAPTTNDMIFYVPLNSVMVFDGTDWVGPKITIPAFGREGATGDSWLFGIGKAQNFPNNNVSTNGIRIPRIVAGSGGGSGWKLYNMSVINNKVVTGDVEIHKNVIATGTPTYGTTGIMRVQLAASREDQTDVVSGIKVSGSSDVIQCFYNKNPDAADDLSVYLTYGIYLEA